MLTYTYHVSQEIQPGEERVVRLIQDANKDLKRVPLILDDMLTKGIVNTLHNQT